MQGIQIVYWALSILFCMAMGFAILLWCRGWRREERAETARQIVALSSQIGRLTQAVDALEHTAASLQTADELLAQHVENLRRAIRKMQTASFSPAEPAEPKSSNIPVPPPAKPPVEAEEEADLYAQARALLEKGRSSVDVARTLDIGTAEVRMIARMMGQEKASGESQSGE